MDVEEVHMRGKERFQGKYHRKKFQNNNHLGKLKLVNDLLFSLENIFVQQFRDPLNLILDYTIILNIHLKNHINIENV